MSSGFVPGGTIDQPTERDDEWLKAQEAIEATRRKKIEDSQQADGKTLYEVLQANKSIYTFAIEAAKQDAFEESIRLKNQFRSLDEDEVEFLDSVLESTRAKEEQVKRDTAEQLEVFRRQREEADKALLIQEGNDGVAGAVPEEEQWGGRKRKKGKEHEGFRGVKLRKGSSTEDKGSTVESRVQTANAPRGSTVKGERPGPDTKTKAINHPSTETTTKTKAVEPPKSLTKSPTSPKPAANLGLGDYSSDEDDDDG